MAKKRKVGNLPRAGRAVLPHAAARCTPTSWAARCATTATSAASSSTTARCTWWSSSWSRAGSSPSRKPAARGSARSAPCTPSPTAGPGRAARLAARAGRGAAARVPALRGRALADRGAAAQREFSPCSGGGSPGSPRSAPRSRPSSTTPSPRAYPALFLIEEEYRLTLLDAESSFVERFIGQITDPGSLASPLWAEFHGPSPPPARNGGGATRTRAARVPWA